MRRFAKNFAKFANAIAESNIFIYDFDLDFCNFAQTLQNFCKKFAIVQIYIYLFLQKFAKNLQNFLASLENFSKGERTSFSRRN